MALPTDELMYDDTWIYILSRSTDELEIVDKCVRARSVRTLIHGGPKGEAKNLYEWYNPDIILLHLGLTDCAPRLIRHGSKIEWFINHSPFANVIYNYIRKYRGRRAENADVPLNDFKDSIEQYVKKVHPVPVGIIKIAEVTKFALAKSPFFNIQIRKYNKVIDDIASAYDNVTVIESFDGSNISLYQSDGMHFSACGQQNIFKNIRSYLFNELNINILPPPRRTERGTLLSCQGYLIFNNFRQCAYEKTAS